MCLPYIHWFGCHFKNEELGKDEIKKKRVQMLPFSWKYKIAPQEQEQITINDDNREGLVMKSKKLASSSKQFRDLAKQLSETTE